MIELLFFIFRMYELVLLVRVVMSWVHPARDNLFSDWIYRLTEPVLEPVRTVLPIRGAGIDFSPLIVLFLLRVVQRVLFGSIGVF